MSLTAVIVLLVFAFGAAFIQRVTGFGFGIFIMTVLPYLLPSYGEATALSGLLALVGVTVTAYRMRHFIRWRLLLPLLAMSVAVSFFAVTAVAHMDNSLLRKILGAFLIVISAYFFLTGGKIRFKPSVRLQLCMGALSGVTGGLFAIQGPPAVIYFISSTDNKEEYMALTSFFFVISNIMMAGFRAWNGFVTLEVGKAWLMALPVVILGMLLGEKVYALMPIATIRKCVYAFMAVAGTVALIS